MLYTKQWFIKLKYELNYCCLSFCILCNYKSLQKFLNLIYLNHSKDKSFFLQNSIKKNFKENHISYSYIQWNFIAVQLFYLLPNSANFLFMQYIYCQTWLIAVLPQITLYMYHYVTQIVGLKMRCIVIILRTVYIRFH